MKIRAFAAAALAAASVASAQPTTVFYSDFDTGTPGEIGGYSINESVAGYGGVGNPGDLFGGNFLRNDSQNSATTLTLTGLPAHTSVSIGFLAALIDSWDSDNGSPAPDYLVIEVDGSEIIRITCANASGTTNYGGDQIAAPIGRGWNGSWGDRGYDMGNEALLQNIAHTGSNLTVSFFAAGAGWQSGLDESWAIDNLEVVADVVPTPGSIALLSLAGLCAARRKR